MSSIRVGFAHVVTTLVGAAVWIRFEICTMPEGVACIYIYIYMHPCVVDLYIYTYICSLLTDSRLDANLSRCWYRQTSCARRRSRGWFEDCTLTKAMALGAAPTCYSSATCRYVVRSTGRPSLWSSARAHSSVCQRRRCSTPSTRPSLCPTWTRARSSSTSTTPLTVCMYIYI